MVRQTRFVEGSVTGGANPKRLSAVSRGFGLIEVLVVVAVIAILATVAVPSFTTLIQDNRMSSQALDLLVALRTAQSEARKSGSVSLCANSAGTDWRTGWVVLTGTNCTLDEDEREILTNGEQRGLSTLSAGVASVRFNRDGSTPNPSQFVFCDNRGAPKAKGVEVTESGLIRANNTGLVCG